MSRWIAGFCVAVLFGVAIAVVQVQTSAGLSWLTILWAAWIVAVLWALTRSSFSLLFAAIMAAMFLFVILPATQAQLFGHTTIAGNDYQAGVVRALEIAALAQCGMLVGAMAVRTSWPVPGFRRLFLRLSSSRLDRAAWQSVFVAILAVIAFSVLGGASLRSFLVYTTPGGYGTFAGAATGDLRYLAAVQCVAGLALVLLPLRLCCSGSSRRLGPLFFAPFFRKIQSENGIGSLRYWFTASLVIQVPVAIVAARRWSTVGAAVAALACSAVFEAAPVARKLSAYHRSEGTVGTPVLRQAGAVICVGCFVVLLAWGRHRMGTVIGFSAIGAITAGLLALHQLVQYLAAARRGTNSSLALNLGSIVPGSEET